MWNMAPVAGVGPEARDALGSFMVTRDTIAIVGEGRL
jgi:hypothetical protein